MSDFDPDTPVKRDVLDSLSARHTRIMWALANNEVRGVVCWDYRTEERTIIKAFYYALAMARTDCSNEWLVLGSGIFALVRSLEEFKPLDVPQIACGLTYAGDIGRVRVFLRPSAPALEFTAGNNDTFARGICTNFPMAFGDEMRRRDNDAVNDAIDPNALHREMVDPLAAPFDFEDDADEEDERCANTVDKEILIDPKPYSSADPYDEEFDIPF